MGWSKYSLLSGNTENRKGIKKETLTPASSSLLSLVSSLLWCPAEERVSLFRLASVPSVCLSPSGPRGNMDIAQKDSDHYYPNFQVIVIHISTLIIINGIIVIQISLIIITVIITVVNNNLKLSPFFLPTQPLHCHQPQIKVPRERQIKCEKKL